MVREPVVSSSIAAIGYARFSRVLEVEFRHGGVYQYLEVPAEEHEAVMRAVSKGEYVNHAIKGCYEYRKVFDRPGSSRSSGVRPRGVASCT